MAGSIVYQGLIQWGAATVLPVRQVTLSPNTVVASDRSSGDPAPTQANILGGAPGMTVSMPAAVAMDTFGTTCAEETTFVASLIKIDPSTGLPAAASGNIQISLQASCKVYGMIESIQCSQNGYATASVSLVFISNDGQTNPLADAAGAALASPGAASLNTLGPFYLDGAAVGGALSVTASFSHISDVDKSDGDDFPTAYGHLAVNTTFQIEHGDPEAVLDDIGLSGSPIASGAVLRFYNVASGVVAATGRTISLTAGAVDMQPIEGAPQGRATTAIMVTAGSAPSFGTF